MTAAVALHAAEREPFVGEKSAWRGYRAEGSSLLLEVDVSELLLCAVDHDKAGVEFFDCPWWREATRLRQTLILPLRGRCLVRAPRHNRRESIVHQLEASVSALGHKRTFREVETMSALPPKADIGR